jgi:hypothetical protein
MKLVLSILLLQFFGELSLEGLLVRLPPGTDGSPNLLHVDVS